MIKTCSPIAARAGTNRSGGKPLTTRRGRGPGAGEFALEFGLGLEPVLQLRARLPRTNLELPWSDRYFAQLGLVLGTAYDSAAVLADDSAPPRLSDPVTDYVPTGRPGHRMPHLWLRDGGSSLDALGEWFTLLTAHPDQSGQLATKPWPLHHEACSEEQADLCGLGNSGALLVRPDGHVAARWSDHLPTDAALERALAVISCLRTSSRLARRRHGESPLP